MIRVGIVGTGEFAAVHAGCWQSIRGVRLTAVTGTYPPRVTEFARRFGILTCDDMEGIIDQCDLIDVVSQNHLHFSQSLEAIDAGCHLLVEKPVATDSRRAEQLAAAAYERGICSGAVHQVRYTDAALALKRTVQSGSIGTPEWIQIECGWPRTDRYYRDNGGWRSDCRKAGGGVLMHQFIHYLDLAIWLFGEMTDIESCTMLMDPDFGIDRSFQAEAIFGKQVTARLAGSTLSDAHAGKTVTVTGTRGEIQLKANRIWHRPLSEPGFIESLQLNAGDPLQRLMTQFVRSIQLRHAFSPSIDDGVRCLRAVERLYQTAEKEMQTAS